MDLSNLPVKEIKDCVWKVEKESELFGQKIKAPLIMIASKKLLEEMDDGVLKQLFNVSLLPGIFGNVLAMPDAHWGYGAPIGGVFATDPPAGGVISPGAVGFDINCGVRLIKTNLEEKDVKPRISQIISKLFSSCGVGIGGRSQLRISHQEIKEVCGQGIDWVIKKGFGWSEDKDHCEENGRMGDASPDSVSQSAFERGLSQLGSLGSGNHYLEIQKVEKIFDEERAKRFGIEKTGQVTIMVHCGSRGFGHQVASDYLMKFNQAMDKYKIEVNDRQLASCPIDSPEGKAYFAAMVCAVNFAFANRQFLTDRIRKVFEEVFGLGAEKLAMSVVYDVCHNVAKFENHKGKRLLIHRKGATRAFDNQPVLIGGSMETKSYLLLGTKIAEDLTFASTCHGAGRTMSRTAAKRQVYGKELQQKMREKGIYVQAASYSGLAEEAGSAYKDVDEVVEAVIKAGISIPVASFFPIGNIKG